MSSILLEMAKEHATAKFLQVGPGTGGVFETDNRIIIRVSNADPVVPFVPLPGTWTSLGARDYGYLAELGCSRAEHRTRL